MGEFVFDQGWADAAERAGISYFPKLLAGVPFTPHSGRRFLVAPGVRAPADGAGAGTRAAAIVRGQQTFLGSREFLRAGRSGGTRAKSVSSNASAISTIGSTPASRPSTITWARSRASGVMQCAMSARRWPPRASRSKCMRATRFPTPVRPDVRYLSVHDREALLGAAISDARVFHLMREHFKRNLCFVCAYRGRKLVAAEPSTSESRACSTGVTGDASRT